ncbi:DNA-(apurinic or apyrimidinic site) lyase [Purpureocillium takamizusanense]|uniref:N-glycosylase/DNA lyase n=1 Tax=Purpureocillium takamizusanense TaxID=2060973 RepID=A0A9Q8V792_9HYPO|nr:DNA-(apurinic or apyrimidinic site) lyase [Purpureocillium takamizusanense]UNI14629.1 DNA-(apurinic or apyrimidinic site) lyase [Purpureocillium takamizusanense]
MAMGTPIKRVSEWRKLPVSLTELSIDTTLRCGQSFRWRKINDEWICTLHGRILALKQDPLHLHYKVTWPDASPSLQRIIPASRGSDGNDDTEDLLRRYFSLDLDLGALYRQWSDADPNFCKKAPEFTGVRILSQDAWEALICFICSSNNNISRISQMVHKLCSNYGPYIGKVDDEALHDFPSPDALTGKQVESQLRELGFGYRAKYIAETARVVAREKPLHWLESLRNPDHQGPSDWMGKEARKATYKEAHEELLSLTGVGPKVADCACLMGLGWGESVPVDTHVWQIAQRDYKFGKAKSKTFNKVMYDAVGDHFRDIWGKYAGWAHSVLFTADLREFSKQAVKEEEKEGSLMMVTTESTLMNSEELRGTRKRRATTKVEVKTEVQTVGAEHGLATEGVAAKRRKTRRTH